MIQSEALFSTFEETKSQDVGININELKNFIKFNLGVFNKVILNHIYLKNQILKTFSDSSKEFNLQEINLAGDFIIYNKAWSYISNINFEENQEYIRKNFPSKFNLSIKMALSFFESQEDYEKCKFLKKFQDLYLT